MTATRNQPNSTASRGSSKITTIIFDVDDTLYDVGTVSQRSISCIFALCKSKRHPRLFWMELFQSGMIDGASIYLAKEGNIASVSFCFSHCLVHNPKCHRRDSLLIVTPMVLHHSW
jgi:hypothetical protein